MPVFRDLRGKSVVQIDGLTRENAGVGVGEKVVIGRVSHKPAAKVVLSPVAAGAVGKDSKFVGRLLEGLPVTVGNKVRATLFGSRFQDFTVIETIPDGVAVINPKS